MNGITREILKEIWRIVEVKDNGAMVAVLVAEVWVNEEDTSLRPDNDPSLIWIPSKKLNASRMRTDKDDTRG
jgi:hypothetical protein